MWMLILGVAALGIWPYLGELGRIPMTADGRIWLEKGHPGAEGWFAWVFETRHFQVGYRPVTAVTYTATLAGVGVNLAVLRLTDLALHLSVAGLLACLVGRFTRGHSPWPGALVALLFLAHPSAEEVVPYLARRSYSLSLLLGLLATWFATGAGIERTSRRIAVFTLAALSVLANELGVLALVPLPLLVMAGRADGGKIGRAGILSAGLGLLAAFLIRQHVLGAVGGYEPDAEGAVGPARALARSADSLLGFEPEGLGSVLALFVVALHLRIARFGDRCGRLVTFALASGLLIGVALFVWLGVWFPRLGYALAPAWAALTGLQLVRAYDASGVRWGGPWFLALLLAGVFPLVGSPLYSGPDGDRDLKWKRRDELTNALVLAIDRVESIAARDPGEGGQRLQLVLPASRFVEEGGEEERARPRLPRDARVPYRWAQFVRPETEVRVNEWVYVEEPDWDWGEPTLLEEVDGELTLVAPTGRRLWTAGPPIRPESGEPNTQILRIRPHERRDRWYVFLHDAEQGGVLVDLQASER